MTWGKVFAIWFAVKMGSGHFDVFVEREKEGKPLVKPVRQE